MKSVSIPPTEERKVDCEVCLKEIPRSSARTEEVNDYVAYFCGLDCYSKWQAKGRNEKN